MKKDGGGNKDRIKKEKSHGEMKRFGQMHEGVRPPPPQHTHTHTYLSALLSDMFRVSCHRELRDFVHYIIGFRHN